MGSPSRRAGRGSKALTETVRAALILERRSKGESLDSIGKSLGVKPETAAKILSEELQRRALVSEPEARHLRQLELDRVDRWTRTQEKRHAANGDPKAAEMLLRLQARRLALSGVRIDLSEPETGRRGGNAIDRVEDRGRLSPAIPAGYPCPSSSPGRRPGLRCWARPGLRASRPGRGGAEPGKRGAGARGYRPSPPRPARAGAQPSPGAEPGAGRISRARVPYSSPYYAGRPAGREQRRMTPRRLAPRGSGLAGRPRPFTVPGPPRPLRDPLRDASPQNLRCVHKRYVLKILRS